MMFRLPYGMSNSKRSIPPRSRRASPNCGGFFDLSALTGRLSEVEARMASPDFWNNRETAQGDVEQVSELRRKIQPFLALESRAADLEVLKELAAEEGRRHTKPMPSPKSVRNTILSCAISKNLSSSNCSPASSTGILRS